MTSPPNNGDTPWLGRSYDTDKIFERIISSSEFLNKSYDPSQFFKNLVNNITNKPYWVKQALFLELRDDIKRMTSIELLEAIDKNDLLQLYAPKTSSLGQKLINEPSFAASMNLSPMALSLIKQADGNKNVIDLCYDNKWPLKLFAQLIIEADSKGIIEEIRSKQILFIFKYIAEEISLSDLLVKLNKITIEQLSHASYTLNQSQSAFDSLESTSIEEVLVRLNYIDKEKLNSLLVLKQASEIVFEGSNDPGSSLQLEGLQESINILASEKQMVEDQLQALQPLLEAKDRRIQELEEELEKYKIELSKCQKNTSIMSKL